MSRTQADRIEATDIRTGYVVATGLGFAGVAIIVGVSLHWIFGKEIHRQMALASTYSLETFPEPRLQKDPREDLLEFQRKEAHAAETYSWKNSSRRRAKIPIDRAIELSIEHDLLRSERPSRPQEKSNGH